MNDNPPVTDGSVPEFLRREPAETSDHILAEHAAEIRRLGARVREDVLEIGRHLVEARDHVGHGAWLTWIEAEFNWSDQTARRFIHLFEQSRDPKFNTLLNSDLSLSALYQLAAPNTPPEARDEIAERAAAGEKLDTAAVIEAIQGKRRKKTPPEPASSAASDREPPADDVDASAAKRKAHYAAGEGDQAGADDHKPASDQEPSSDDTSLMTLWRRSSKQARSAFLDALGVEAVLENISAEFSRALQNRVPAFGRGRAGSEKSKFKKIKGVRIDKDANGSPIFTLEREDPPRH